MHWPSLLIGIVLGWIIEWLIDFFFTRKRRNDWTNTEADLRVQLANALAENNALQAQLAAQQEAVREAQEPPETATRAPEAAALAAAVLAGEKAAVTRDDLTIIEGIGDKSAELLNQQGIYTFSELADTDVDRLRGILSAAGPAFRLVVPDTWPRQARLAANRDWVRLQSLKEELTGGVRRPEEPEQVVDDLTIIEGIGDKTAGLLNQHGIYAFAELADTDVSRLREILAAAGPAFRLAVPDTWPRQARLAANRDWVRLQTVKEQLTGGVRRPSGPEPATEVDSDSEPAVMEEEIGDEGEDLAIEAEVAPGPPPETEAEAPVMEEEAGDRGEDLAVEAEAAPGPPPEPETETPVMEAETGDEGEDLAAEEEESPPAEAGG